MLTFKNLKNLVDLPAHKEARVPTVKALEESGVSVVAEKILENHGSIYVLLWAWLPGGASVNQGNSL